MVDAAEVDADGGMPPPEPHPCSEWESAFPEGAFVVAPERAAELQTLLDTHGTLRLAAGADYRTEGPSEVRLGSGQAIVSLGRTLFPDVVVQAGTEFAKLRGLSRAEIRFESGEPSRHNCFMNQRLTRIVAHGAMVERNHFIDFAQASIDVDTAEEGWFRDNVFIKINAHGGARPISLLGDEARRSGGNVFLLVDSLTAANAPFRIDGQEDATFVGINAEAFNWSQSDPEPFLFRVTNTGTFRAHHFVGISRRGDTEYPMLDLDADTVSIHEAVASLSGPKVRLGPNVATSFSWANGWTDEDIVDAAPTGGLRVHAFPGSEGAAAVRVDGVDVTEPVSTEVGERLVAALSDSRDGMPWALPDFHAVPDPTGPDWATAREGRLDERASIQAMLDTDGVAELEPRTYYIDGPLVLGKGNALVGAGMGRTAIVALDPTKDLVRVVWGEADSCGTETGPFTVAELTLQGGAVGIESDHPGMQINQAIISHVAFRDMAIAGLRIAGTYGWDNNFFDHLAFVDCAHGVLQEGQPRPDDSCYPLGEWSTMSYLDKTVFYRSQFVRCGRAVALRPSRANHLDAFVETRFVAGTDGAIEIGSGNAGTVAASCLFENNAGDPVVQGRIRLLNSRFVAGSATSQLGPGADVEGCTFEGEGTGAVLFGHVRPGDVRNAVHFSVANSTSDLPLGPVDESVPVAGLYLNTMLRAEEDEPHRAFLWALDYRTQGTPWEDDDTRAIQVVADGIPTPGSQLLFQRALRSD